MKSVKNVLLLLVLSLLFSEISGCLKQNEDRRVSTKQEEDEDDEDETEEDVARAEDQEDFDRICDSHVPKQRQQRLPDVVIIGAKKGGTRALIEFLKLHPRLKAAGPEIHFFDKHFEKGLEWYKSQMPQVSETELAVEKTPGYFHHQLAPKRLHEALPEARLLLILRDPVKRLVSDYNQFRSKHLRQNLSYPSLTELVYPSSELDLSYPPLQRSIYHQYVRIWLDLFPKSQLHVVQGDNFIREPWTELQKVEEFLEVEPVIKEEHFFFNLTKGFYCSIEERRTGVWSCTKKKCLSKSKGRPKPHVEESTIEALTEFFRKHNAKLNELLNRDFGWPI